MDCFVTDPHDNALYNEKKKQYDSFSHTTTMKGVYQVCFSNEFSTFTHKVVYLDFRHGNEEPILDSMKRTTALTQVSNEHGAFSVSGAVCLFVFKNMLDYLIANLLPYHCLNIAAFN